MKRTSAPEQALLYYIRKYVDHNATNSTVHVGKYTADISFEHNKVEYDSYSQHCQKTDSDIARNDTFQKNGYIVLWMRDKNLDFLPNCKNIRFDFQDYRKSSLRKARQGILEMFDFLGIHEEIDFENDASAIRQMYMDA